MDGSGQANMTRKLAGKAGKPPGHVLCESVRCVPKTRAPSPQATPVPRTTARVLGRCALQRCAFERGGAAPGPLGWRACDFLVFFFSVEAPPLGT